MPVLDLLQACAGKHLFPSTLLVLLENPVPLTLGNNASKRRGTTKLGCPLRSG